MTEHVVAARSRRRDARRQRKSWNGALRRGILGCWWRRVRIRRGHGLAGLASVVVRPGRDAVGRVQAERCDWGVSGTTVSCIGRPGWWASRHERYGYQRGLAVVLRANGYDATLSLQRRRHRVRRHPSFRPLRLIGSRTRARRSFQRSCLSSRRGQRQRHPSLNPPHPVLPTIHIRLGVVVHPQPHKRHPDAKRLNWMDGLSEPRDGHENDDDALDERGDRVRDGRRGGQDGERDDVLRPMDGAVEEEVVHDAVSGCRSMSRGFMVVVFEQPRKVGPSPDGDHQQERQPGRVEKKVQLVQLVARRDRRSVRSTRRLARHDLLEEDVAGDEDDGGTESADETEGVVEGEIEGARQHNSKGEREKGDVGPGRVADSKQKRVCRNREKWRKRLDCVNGADGNAGNRHAGEYVATDLEYRHGKRIPHDGRSGPSQLCESVPRVGEKQAVARNESELDKGQSDGEFELVHDLLSRVG